MKWSDKDYVFWIGILTEFELIISELLLALTIVQRYSTERGYVHLDLNGNFSISMCH